MRILLSILTFWIRLPAFLLAFGLERVGLDRAGSAVGAFGLWLSAIPVEVE